FMTAFYSWRLLILTFHGKPRADEHVMAHVHESPAVMTVPLILLSIGAIFAGGLGKNGFIGEGMEHFWGKAILLLESHQTMENLHHVPTTIALLPTIVAVAGIALAYALYTFNPTVPAKLATTFRPIYLFMLNKWYMDELYDFLFVRPAFKLGKGLWKKGD